jgi:hypothetical protein
MARRQRGVLCELRRGLRRSTPNRMLARYLSGGRHQTLTAILAALFGLKLRGPRRIPMRPVPWGSPVPMSEKAAQRARGGEPDDA